MKLQYRRCCCEADGNDLCLNRVDGIRCGLTFIASYAVVLLGCSRCRRDGEYMIIAPLALALRKLRFVGRLAGIHACPVATSWHWNPKALTAWPKRRRIFRSP